MKCYKTVGIVITAMCITMLAGCGNMSNSAALETKNTAVASAQEKKAESEEDGMKLSINGAEYEVVLEQNDTVKDIVKHMPLKLDMVRFAGHEFYSKLSFTPNLAKDRTSKIKAGHVYYWDGWNAFVINYIDSDISPYQVVHIGEIKDKSICNLLATTTNNIQIEVK